MPVDWDKLAVACLDPEAVRRVIPQLQERAGAWFRAAPIDSVQALVAVIAASPSIAGSLLRFPEWLGPTLDASSLEFGRRLEGLRREVSALLDAALSRGDHPQALRDLRRFRQREQIRIAARDITGRADLPAITRELSELAEVCLAGVLRVIRAQLASQVGEPWHLDADGEWRPTEFCVLGLGKLGGLELNYCPAVALMFVYEQEGFVFRNPPRERSSPPPDAPDSRSFFQHLCESYVAELGTLTEDGVVYRVNLGLRPEGEAGPLVRSLASCEAHYAQSGQTWERLVLMKARPVAGDRHLGNEFVEAVHQFRYPRNVGPRALGDIAAAKHRMEAGLDAGMLDRDVKLGRGGIREIELVVQSQQLLHGGKQPFLQGPGTLAMLDQLEAYRLLSKDEANRLAGAYRFWRSIEHRLQLENGEPVHTVPEDSRGRTRLAHLLGCRRLADFETKRRDHARFVRATFERIFDLVPQATTPKPTCTIFPPGPAAERFERFVSAHGARAQLYEALESHPAFHEVVALLFDQSEALAEVAIQAPRLVEELVLNGRLRRARPVDETLRDLRFGIDDSDQRQWIRKYHQAEQLRIGLRSLLGLADAAQVGVELTALADACLLYALEIATRRHRLKRSPFALIGLGKLGARELSFGSPLELAFISPPDRHRLTAAHRTATTLLQLIGEEDGSDSAFKAAVRLCPEGSKGPLACPLDEFEAHFQQRAELCELQLLTRRRFIGGDADLGEDFLKVAAHFTDFAKGNPGVRCWTPQWRATIWESRATLGASPATSGRREALLADVSGGLLSADCLAESSSMADGIHEPSTDAALARIRGSWKPNAAGIEDALAAYRELRRIDTVVRRSTFGDASHFLGEPVASSRLAIQCGFTDLASLLKACRRARRKIEALGNSWASSRRASGNPARESE